MKIQLKRSNVLDGGEAKKPTAAQMEYGELAVNYNDADPALFIKDSNDAIIRIAGAGANGNIEIPDSGGGPNQPGTLDDRYVEISGDTMTGQLTLPGGGGDTQALQKQEIEALIDASDTGDGNYLKLAANAGNQTVASTGTTTFASDVVINGLNVGRGGGDLNNTVVGLDSLLNNTTGASNTALGQETLTSNISGNLNTAVGKNAGRWIEGSNNTILGAYEGTSADAALNDTVIIAAGKTERIRIDENGYTFTPGSVYIGGSPARNTRELWESTLTEEQKEQLAAGTLVVPANVSLPGDGEFARQWYYDQQDAETQAELDAGTLNYPTHLAAATFTDTFDLGDNTNINVLSSGTIFANQINLRYGAKFTQSSNVSKGFFVQHNIVSPAGAGIGMKSVNSPSDASNPQSNCPRIFFNRCQDPSGLQVDEDKRVISTNLEPSNENSIVGEMKFSTSQGELDLYLAEIIAYTRASGGELELVSYNPTNDVNHRYYFGPDGEFGYREGLVETFKINTDTDSTKLTTIRNEFTFTSSGGVAIVQDGRIGSSISNFQRSGSKFETVVGGNEVGLAVIGSSSGVKRDMLTFHNPDLVQVGNISIKNSVTTYSTSSDYRLKENVVNLTGAIDRLKLIKVRRFNFINHEPTVDGFIAHELQEVVPEAVTGEKDGVDENGKPNYQGVDQSKIVPLLTKALQEALERIEALEAAQ